jgi:hypothetical protein
MLIYLLQKANEINNILWNLDQANKRTVICYKLSAVTESRTNYTVKLGKYTYRSRCILMFRNLFLS